MDKISFENLKKQSKWGGKRDNSGRAKGSTNKATKEQKLVEDEFKQRVLSSMNKLINSQMNLAEGCQMLFKIETYKYKDKKGEWKEEKKKPVIVTDQSEIEDYLAGDLEDEDDYYFLTTQKPDNKAIDSLVDRVFGRAKQSISLEGNLTISRLLDNLKDKQNGEANKGTKSDG